MRMLKVDVHVLGSMQLELSASNYFCSAGDGGAGNSTGTVFETWVIAVIWLVFWARPLLAVLDGIHALRSRYGSIFGAGLVMNS